MNNNVCCKSNRIKISSILFGVFMNLSCIAVYLFPSATGATESNGMVGLMYIAVIGSILVSSIFNHTFFAKNRKVWFMMIGIMIFYFYSVVYFPEPRTPFNNFIVFTIVALFIPSIVTINTQWVLLAVIFTTIPALFNIKTIFFSTVLSYTSDDILSQGYSYAFLVPSVCTIIYLKHYLKRDFGRTKLLTTAAIFINLLFTFYLISMGSRGPVMAICFLIVLLYVSDIRIDMQEVTLKKKKTILLLVFMLFASFYFVRILEFIQSTLSDFGVTMHFIDKFLIRNEAGDMTSSRSDIFELAINGFYNKPLFGNGFDQFSNNTQWPYPHNFITQILYDGGIYLFSIVLFPVIVCFRKWYKKCNYDEFNLVIALLFSSVPGCLFSGNLWTSSTLWLFFGTVINYQNIKVKCHECI